MKPLIYALIGILLLLIAAFIIQNSNKLIRLTIKDSPIFCELAFTPKSREVGLMNRDSLPRNRGMLFMYKDEDIRHFHMQNVKFPIDIAFINGQGVIVDIQEMPAIGGITYTSKKPAMFALEANKGWFKDNKINNGDKIIGLEEAIRKAIND